MYGYKKSPRKVHNELFSVIFLAIATPDNKALLIPRYQLVAFYSLFSPIAGSVAVII
jgi:hypothetical protein